VTDDELDLIERLAGSAGLIKVWDGSEWRDLRVVVKHLVTHIKGLQARCDAHEQRFDALLNEYDKTLRTLDDAHAEIATLGNLLRNG
jgi:hypothetical protein